MAMSFTSLTAASKATAGSIRRWVNHDEVDADQILEEAQGVIFQTLRVREMRKEFTALSLAVGDSSKALPSDFLDPIVLWDLTNDARVRLRTEEALMAKRRYDSGVLVSGLPLNYAIFDEKLQFEYKYESAASLSLIGFYRPALLASGNLTNFLTTRYPLLLRVACMAQAFSFRDKDERAKDEWEKLSTLIAATNAESDLTYRGLETEVEPR